MYPDIRCYTCNNSIGEYIEIFEILKNHLYEIELKKIYNLSKSDDDITKKYNPAQIEINSFIDIKLNEIFKLLKIDKYCCKSNLITNVNFDSLIYSSINN